MELHGEWNAGVTYAVNDVVVFEGLVYHLQRLAPAGTPPTDTLYWGKVGQQLSEAILLMMDVYNANADELDATMAAKFPTDKELVLASSTAASTKVFVITVDDDGELTATEQTASDG